jgi:hypothetical protein
VTRRPRTSATRGIAWYTTVRRPRARRPTSPGELHGVRSSMP